MYREAQARQIQNGASVSALFGGGTARYHTHGFSFTSRTPDLFAQSEGADVQDITRVFIIASYQMVNNDFFSFQSSPVSLRPQDLVSTSHTPSRPQTVSPLPTALEHSVTSLPREVMPHS